ncbi:hypothetical protein Gorai_018120, partial [Gossypium raimondii]|nr:hypothetical protein [Gossypium raimondii]
MVTEEGIWNLDIFRIWLSEDIIRRIASIPLPDSSVGYDRIACIRSGSGSFSIKSAYKMLSENSWDQRGKVERVRRDIGVEERCTICGLCVEDVLHAIKDCSVAKDGAAKIDFGDAATGVIIKDQQRNWILGFNRRLGQSLMLSFE